METIDRLRYYKSKYWDAHYYECPICKISIKPFMIEGASSFTCKCGQTFDRKEIREAKDKYIETLEYKLKENNIV